MNDDTWMRELGRLAAAEERDDDERFAIWERLSAGDLSAEEMAALRAQAETSEEARQAYEAFRPLGAGFEARLAGALHHDLAPLAPVLPFSRYGKRIGGWLAAAAAVAASLVALFLGRTPLPPLPPFALETSPAIQTTRGLSPEATSTFRRGGKVEFLLRPATAVSGESDAKCCWLARGKSWRSWPLSGESSGQSFRFTGVLGRDVEPGVWTLLAVVGRPGSLPGEAALRARLGRVRPPDLRAQIVSTDVTIVP